MAKIKTSQKVAEILIFLIIWPLGLIYELLMAWLKVLIQNWHKEIKIPSLRQRKLDEQVVIMF